MTRKKQRATGIFGLFLAILCLTIILGCPGPSVTEQERSIAGTFTYPYLYSALGSTTGELSAGQAVEDGTKKTVPVISEGPVWKDADANQKVNLKYTITPPSGDKGGPGKVEINESTGAVTIGEDATATDNGTYTITVEGKGLYTLLGTKITASIEIRVADKAIAGRLGYSDESGASVITVSHGGSDEGSKGVAWTGNENSKDQTVAYTITSKDGSAAPAGIAVKADGTVTVATNVAVKHSGIYKVIASGTGDYGGRSTTEVEIKIEPAANLPSGATKDNLSFSYENISVAAKIPLKATQVEPKWAAETGDVNAILSDLDVTYSMGEDAEGAATKLPAGMTLDAKTGEISGQANIEDKEDKTPTELSAVIKATLSSSNYTGTLDLDPVTVTFTITTAKTPLPEAAFSYGAALEVAYGSGSSSKSGGPVWDVSPEVEKDENGDYPFLAEVEYSIAKQEDGSTSDRILVDPAGIVTVTKDAGVADNGNYLVTAKAKADSTYSGEITADVPITIKINTFDLKDAAIKAVNPINVFYGDPGATGPLSLTGTPTTLVVGTDVTYSITKDGSIVTGIIVDGTVLRTANTVQVASSGTYTVTATGIGNYTGSITQDVTVIIQKRALNRLTLTAPGSVTTTYGTAGVSDTVVSLTPAAGGTTPTGVTYSITKDGSVVPGVSIDTGKKVVVSDNVSGASSGTYVVTAETTTDPNYTGSASANVTVTINKKDISTLTLTPPSSVTTRPGTAKTSSTAASLSGLGAGTTTPVVTYSITKNGGGDATGVSMDPAEGKVVVSDIASTASAGDYTVTATVAATDPNYEGSATAVFTVTINQIDISTMTLNVPGDEISVVYGTGGSSDTGVSLTTTAGDTVTTGVTYSITKDSSAVLGVSIDENSRKIVIGNTVLVASSGDYTVTATGTGGYTGSTSAAVKIAIGKKSIGTLVFTAPSGIIATHGFAKTSSTAASLSKVDGGTTPVVTYSIARGSNAVPGVTMTADGKVSVAANVPAETSAVDYTVTATAAPTDPNYTGSTTGNVSVSVNAKFHGPSDFEAPSDVSTTYGTAATSEDAVSSAGDGLPPDATYSIAKDGSAVLGVTMVDGKVNVGSTVQVASSGTYTVTAVSKSTDTNYSGSTTFEVEVTISKKDISELTLTPPSAVTTTYGIAATSTTAVSLDQVTGGTPPDVAYHTTKVDGNFIGVTLTTDGKIDVSDTAPVISSGTHTVVAKANSADPNYTGEVSGEVEVTIERRELDDAGVSFSYTPSTITTQTGTAATGDASWTWGRVPAVSGITYSLSPTTVGVTVNPTTGEVTVGTTATAQTDTAITVTATVPESANHKGGTLTSPVQITVNP